MSDKMNTKHLFFHVLIFLSAAAGAAEWEIGAFCCSDWPFSIRQGEEFSMRGKFIVVLPPWRFFSSETLREFARSDEGVSGVLAAGAYRFPYRQKLVRSNGNAIDFSLQLDTPEGTPLQKELNPCWCLSIQMDQAKAAGLFVGGKPVVLPPGNRWSWTNQLSFPKVGLVMKTGTPCSINLIGSDTLQIRIIARETERAEGGKRWKIDGSLLLGQQEKKAE